MTLCYLLLKAIFIHLFVAVTGVEVVKTCRSGCCVISVNARQSRVISCRESELVKPVVLFGREVKDTLCIGFVLGSKHPT